ncbi:MAG: acyl-CoA dehydratase activase [Sandaracinaceae bacterium]|nr:acyl-CoA dehydratase activase [Sandaracinaceae bacterium]
MTTDRNFDSGALDCFVGIDLGSTTTKAVVLGPTGDVIGRGITNSRSNYDLACDLARSEALVDAQMTRFRGALEREPLLASHARVLGPALERAFRYRQHVRQLDTLASVGTELAKDDEALAKVVSTIFGAMYHEADRAFAGLGTTHRSEFFRDVAGAQFQRLAEDQANARTLPYDRIVGVFDRAILRVENEPDDLSFEGNARAALARALERYPKAEHAVRIEAERVLAAVLEQPPNLRCTVGTGYGRARLPFPKSQIRSEILCHGLGAHRMFPRTRTVLDIGGQDTKAIQVDERGIVTRFQMNDRCAAGCGRYLGYIADGMNIGVHELGPLAERSTRQVRISSTCTVFAGAELRERLSLGERREDILAGLHRAIILRAMSLLARSGGVEEELTFTGGVAHNAMAVRVLTELVAENYGARTLNVSPSSIYTGALGAAMFAKRHAEGADEPLPELEASGDSDLAGNDLVNEVSA